MMKKSKLILFVVLSIMLIGSPAEASWVHPNKKPVTAWQGFQDSANGAVSHVLPWNWFGKRDQS